MAEDNFKRIITGFILLTLFSFLILTFVVDVAQDNNKDTSELEEGAFSLDQYEDFLEDVDEDAETFRERFEKGNIFSVVAGIVVEGIFGIASDMVTLAVTPFTLLAQVMNNVLGVPTIVTSVVLGLIVLSIILGIWRLLKVGD